MTLFFDLIDWTGLEGFRCDFDAADLPHCDYGGDIGLKYNAITMAQWGLFDLQEGAGGVPFPNHCYFCDSENRSTWRDSLNRQNAKN